MIRFGALAFAAVLMCSSAVLADELHLPSNTPIPPGSHKIDALPGSRFTLPRGAPTDTVPQRLPAYIVEKMPTCSADAKGDYILLTDVFGAPYYRQTIFSGGGLLIVPAYCNGTAWELH